MPEFTIRSAVGADADALSALAAETFPLACPPHTTAESIAAFIALHFTPARFAEYLADPARAVVVADGDGTLHAYAMLVAGEPADADAAEATRRPTIELSKFYARAADHGSGVAAALMSAVLEIATATGAATCWLGVNEENARAVRFYERHGFAKVGRKRFKVGDRLEHDFVLERRLR